MTDGSTIGAPGDYFSIQFQDVTPSKSSVAIGFEIDEAPAKGRHEEVQRTYRRSPTVISLGSRTAKTTEIADYLNVAKRHSELDKIRGIVRDFANLDAGWDGPDSIAALGGVVDDVLEVLQRWERDIDIPEPVMACDGTIALEVYDSNGFTKGGVEFKGLHKAVYTVISGTELVTSGTFNVDSPSEIIKSIEHFRHAHSSK